MITSMGVRGKTKSFSTSAKTLMILALIKVHKKTAPRQMVVPRKGPMMRRLYSTKVRRGNLWASLIITKAAPTARMCPKKRLSQPSGPAS
jgi:hypothetical protein